jgi:hypothetical protein
MDLLLQHLSKCPLTSAGVMSYQLFLVVTFLLASMNPTDRESRMTMVRNIVIIFIFANCNSILSEQRRLTECTAENNLHTLYEATSMSFISRTIHSSFYSSFVISTFASEKLTRNMLQTSSIDSCEG